MGSSLLPIHLDLINKNPAGAVFCSPATRLVALRWSCQDNLQESAALAKEGLEALASFGGDTLLYDTTALRGRGCADSTLLYCARHESVRKMAIAAEDVASVSNDTALRSTLQECRSAWSVAHTALGALQPLTGRLLRGNHWFATYAGSVSNLPRARTTVIRTSGANEPGARLRQLFRRGLAFHRSLRNTSLIVDTTSSAPANTAEDYMCLYRDFVLPYSTSGLFKQIIHVRCGDALIGEDQPALAPLVTSLGVPFFDVSAYTDAVRLIHLLKGHSFSSPKLLSTLTVNDLSGQLDNRGF